MMEYQANPNDSIFVRIALARTDTGLFPQTKIYAIDAPSTVIDTVNLAEISNGLYGIEWTNNGERKKYFTQTIVYTDSGHTAVHPIIRPDSDSINVGFNSSGFSIGGKSGTFRQGLTKEEINQIAKAVLRLLKPELAKKSEFDPVKDTVKTDITIPTIPEFPDLQTISDEIHARLKIEKLLLASTKEITGRVNAIKIPEFPVVPTVEQIGERLDEVVTAHHVDHRPEMERLANEIAGIIPEQATKMNEMHDMVTPVIESKEASDSMLGAISALIVKKTQEEISKEVKKEDVMDAIRNGENAYKVFKLFQQLSLRDKQIVFSILALKNRPLLKKLAIVAKSYV